MNRVVPLVETPLVRVLRWEHPGEEPHRDPREERAASVSLNFVLGGSFAVRSGRRKLEVTPRTLFATRPGLAYRTYHQEDHPTDVCLSVEYSPGFVGEGELAGAPASPVLPLNNRTAYLKWRLLRALERRRSGAAFDEIGVDLLDAVLHPEPGGFLFREKTLAWYAERIEGARTRLEESFHERHSLRSLARSAGMSPFHFARLFRALVGTPPGRYLLLTRLDRAHRLLRQNRPVTDVCFDCGFRNLSYFTRAFRKRFRIPPSAARSK